MHPHKPALIAAVRRQCQSPCVLVVGQNPPSSNSRGKLPGRGTNPRARRHFRTRRPRLGCGAGTGAIPRVARVRRCLARSSPKCRRVRLQTSRTMQPVLMLEQFWSCSSRFANNRAHHIECTIVTVHSAAESTTFRRQPNISATAQVRALAADHSITNKLNGRHGLGESFQWCRSTSIINCRGANVTSPLTGPTATRALIEELE